ncbi:MAG: hypothetical protein R3B70_25830 [Polyangiaceae bacterium]
MCRRGRRGVIYKATAHEPGSFGSMEELRRALLEVAGSLRRRRGGSAAFGG